jgi:hypothetical protein
MLPSSADPKIYELARMLPPGSHRYFFTYRGELVIARDQEKSLNAMGPSFEPPKKEYFTLDLYKTK